jgi:hypothetical protein
VLQQSTRQSSPPRFAFQALDGPHEQLPRSLRRYSGCRANRCEGSTLLAIEPIPQRDQPLKLGGQVPHHYADVVASVNHGNVSLGCGVRDIS